MKWIRDFLIHDDAYLAATGRRLNAGLIYALDLPNFGADGSYGAGIPVLWTPFQADREICESSWDYVSIYLHGRGDGVEQLERNTMALINFEPGKLFV